MPKFLVRQKLIIFLIYIRNIYSYIYIFIYKYIYKNIYKKYIYIFSSWSFWDPFDVNICSFNFVSEVSDFIYLISFFFSFYILF